MCKNCLLLTIKWSMVLHEWVSFKHSFFVGATKTLHREYQSSNDDEVIYQQPPAWMQWSSSLNDIVPYSRYLQFFRLWSDNSSSIRVHHKRFNSASLFKSSFVRKYSLKLLEMSFILLFITILDICFLYAEFLPVCLGVKCRCRI